MISKELLDILACPLCKSDVIYDEGKDKIICVKCGKAYPVKEEIPIMLIEETESKEEREKKQDIDGAL